MLRQVAILVCALVLFGCNKSRDSNPQATQPAADTPVADFSSLDPQSWVHGSPASLAAARGAEVVLIEAWHPA